MPAEDRVRIEIEAGVAQVRMVRADKLNAIDHAMFAALSEAGVSLMGDKSVRAVVLSGEGRAFCAGLDIPGLMAGGGQQGPNLFERTGESPANLAQRCAWVWQEVPVPVIAAVHGVAYGGGFQIAMGADIRFVAPDARLSLREMHWGLIPDVAVTQTLRHVVRHDVAKELTFTARVVSGSEALELGLATHVSEAPLADATALAREIATKNPSAIRAAKQLWNQALDGSVEEGLQLEEKLQRTVIGKPNQVEAVRANMERRDPSFDDPE